MSLPILRFRAGLGSALAVLVFATFTLFFSGCVPQRVSSDSLYQRADTLRREGKLDAALAETEHGLAYSAKVPAQYWKFYLERAEILQQQQNPERVLALLSKEPPDTPDFAELRARSKCDQAFAEITLSNYPEAKRLLDAAAANAEFAPGQVLLAPIYFLQAQVLVQLQDLAAAEALIRHGAQLAEAAGNREQQAYGLQTLAQFLMSRSRYEDALNVLEAQRRLIGENGERAVMARVLLGMGLCRHKLGELDEALALDTKAEELTRELGDRRNHQIVLGNIGAIYLDRGEIETARRYFKQALAAAVELSGKSTTAAWLGNLAELSIQTRKWKEASAYNLQALKLRRRLTNRTAELYSLVNSALILEGEGKTAAAEQMFSEIARAHTDDPLPLLKAHSGLAHLYSTTGQDEKADREFQSALLIVEKSRSALHQDQTKIDFLASLMSVHEEYVDFLMSRGRTERALEIAEASRARILQEKLGKTEATRTVSASSYRRLAEGGGANLLSYWLGAKRSYVWLTTPRQVIAYSLPPREQIRKQVENYRALIENLRDPLDSDDATGRQLYETLIAPVAERLPAGANLIIVPDGPLNALNFETLPVASPNLHYFIEDATVSVAPSLNLLVQRGASAIQAPRLLLIGDPDSSDDSYPKLRYAEKEIKAVESHFERANVSFFSKGNAVPAVYRQSAGGGFNYVHFTAHASTNGQVPLDSAIILSGKGGLSKLTARDVLSQPLHGGMVTISACRSAGAKTYAGEGLVGFVWAFFRAGARSIIAGLWDVSDESTPLLMDDLYAGVTRGQPAAKALREAKLQVMKSNGVYKLPYYWGPFQLYIHDAPMAKPNKAW